MVLVRALMGGCWGYFERFVKQPLPYLHLSPLARLYGLFLSGWGND